MKSDSAVRGWNIMVGFSEHGIKAVQGHISTQKLVSHFVYLYQAIQLLQKTRRKKENDAFNKVEKLSKVHK